MAARRRASPPSAAEAFGPVRVARIGADGDGLAEGPAGQKLFLANTLPGELVQPATLTKRGDGWAGPAEILEPSPDRVTPPCPHFGPCGGCTLQHWSDAAYARWKLDRVAGSAGLAAPALARSPPGTRRRMDLAIRRERGAILIGLHQRRSAEIVDMQACPILHPTLFGLVQALRPALVRLEGLRRAGEASVNLLETGPDLLLRTDAPLSARDRTNLADFARREGCPRISWASLGADVSEPAAHLTPPILSFSGWRTEIPPGAFLQATQEGERAIVEAVLLALPARIKGAIVELFAGCGSLTHALSARARVLAYEGDPAAAAALRRAANPRVQVTVRDLVRQPLAAGELKAAGAIVLDPPFGGAAAQMHALAASGLPIVYVSCNPAALARDASTLLAAGYVVRSVAGIDQFLWSTQVETVIGFTRA